MHAVTILCVDDDALLLDYLARLLEEVAPAGMTVLKAGDGATGLRLGGECKPSLVILDLGLPDMSGARVLAGLATICPPPRVLVLTAASPESAMIQLEGSRIHGLLAKSSAQGSELKQALNEVLAGRTYFPGPVMTAIAKARREPDHFTKILSPRETGLLPLFGYGWTHDRIARHAGLSPATVRTHHQNILAKLNLHGRGQLMAWAIRKGLVDFRHEPGNDGSGPGR